MTEYGTRFGYELMMEARTLFLQEFSDECIIVAPCPHSLSCPFSLPLASKSSPIVTETSIFHSDLSSSPSLSSRSSPSSETEQETNEKEREERSKTEERPRIGERDFCSFVQRIALTKSQRSLRRSLSGQIIMPYCYLVLRRVDPLSMPPPPPPPPPSSSSSSSSSSSETEKEREETKVLDPQNQRFSRVLSPTKKRGKHVLLDLCTPEGKVERKTVPFSLGRFWYRSARSCAPGDGLLFPIAERLSVSTKPKRFDPEYRRLKSSLRNRSEDSSKQSKPKKSTKKSFGKKDKERTKTSRRSRIRELKKSSSSPLDSKSDPNLPHFFV